MSAIARAQAEAASAAPATPHSLGQVERLFERVRALLKQNPPLAVGDLAVTGNDLRQELNLTPGPLLGRLLQALLELVLDDPEQNQRPRLLALARETLSKLDPS